MQHYTFRTAKQHKSYKLGVFSYCILPILIILMGSQSGYAQKIDYHPDLIFKGSHYTLDVKWVSNFRTEYEHLDGYEYTISSPPDFGYEIGFKWKYYFNRSWSVETGIEAGSRRYLVFNYDLRDAFILQSITTDPLALESFTLFVENLDPGKIGLGPTFAIPLHIGYHQYPGQSKRHILDYKLGMAVRFHIPMYIKRYTHQVILQTSDSMELNVLLHHLRYDWYFGKKVSIDFQPYFGYTFIPKNRHAFSIGLLANLSFEKDYGTTELFKVLPGTAYEGSGKFHVKPHYLAVQFSFTFTTKRNSLAVKSKKQKALARQ